MPPIDDEATAKRAAITTGSSPNPARPAEEVLVTARRVSCDGVGGALGHPRVYMEMGDSAFVECGYCDRRFVLAPDAHAEDEHAAPAAYEGSAGR
jgi:uncharacterized Zn-finger protein